MIVSTGAAKEISVKIANRTLLFELRRFLNSRQLDLQMRDFYLQ